MGLYVTGPNGYRLERRSHRTGVFSVGAGESVLVHTVSLLRQRRLPRRPRKRLHPVRKALPPCKAVLPSCAKGRLFAAYPLRSLVPQRGVP